MDHFRLLETPRVTLQPCLVLTESLCCDSRRSPSWIQHCLVSTHGLFLAISSVSALQSPSIPTQDLRVGNR